MDSIEYYNKYVVKIYEDTVDVDMSDIMKGFLDQLEERDTIFGLGCGSGRNSLTPYELGYDVTLLDASEKVYKLAEIHIGLGVLQMTSGEMEFEDTFDGIWVRGFLLHVPEGEVEGILIKPVNALCAQGVSYISVQKGDFRGFHRERYLSDYTEDSLKAMLNRTGPFEVIWIWETEDMRSIHLDTVWINPLARKK